MMIEEILLLELVADLNSRIKDIKSKEVLSKIDLAKLEVMYDVLKKIGYAE